ncbi:uncharacterized protein LY89DRAFT_628854 [Mollisia scopiformis]|uniref:Polycomb protein VEFS-Box domain-containing protein n=1 Tax=Mollisia scopiformis TaxID=149040 RepID=A0A132B9U3_MOLSC|nr:uncharacterized protein LY89DRAFT_628854 [Mollisia scopiformis]KUJ09013.1 hypothetical protein LY89DRAFT_628854 [Mollisia scopiformis]
MSSVTSKGEGEAALSVYSLLYIPSRRKPFLRRNVRKTLQHLTMGAKLSAMTSSRGTKPRDDPMDVDDEEDEEPRPPKRRRIHPPESRDVSAAATDDAGPSRQPLSQVMSNQRSRPSKPELVQPYDFYGKAKAPSLTSSLLKTPTTATATNIEANAETNNFRIDDITPATLADFKEALRVDVNEIIPSDEGIDDEPFNFTSNFDMRCTVRVAIFYRQHDDIQEGNTKPVEISRKDTECTLRVTIARNGKVSRDLVDLEPFYFLPSSFKVRRRKPRQPNGQWGGYEYYRGFADRYLLSISIHPVSSEEDWPTLNLSAGASEYKMDEFCLHTKINLFCHPERQRKAPLQLEHIEIIGAKIALSYALSFQVRWATPNVLTNAVLPTIKSDETPRAKVPLAPTPAPAQDEPASPSPRKEDETTIEESTASNRAKRHRNSVETYNLKTLSTLAQGKSPRKSKPKESRSEPEPDAGLTVTYCFGKAEAADTGIKQQTTVPGLACPFCETPNSMVEELRLHLHADHGAFKFSLRRNSPRVQFFVELARSRSGPMLDTDRAKIYQLGKPRTLFDLDKYLLGDDLWTKTRLGPQHGHWPDHLLERANEPSMSSSPHGSRYSSPNTSNGTDDAMDFETYEAKPPVRRRKVVLVPETELPLYDPVTKRILRVGEEIPGSDDEKEEEWLHQKQRQLVNDFVDVSMLEKEYINVWNPFINEEHLTSHAYMSDSILRFVELKKNWFAENKNMKVEFLRHMEIFITMGSADQECLHKCINILRKAEQDKARRDQQEDTIMKDVEVEKPVSKSRGLLTCICGTSTQPPNQVICTGDKCPARFFCRQCALSSGRPIKDKLKKWQCDECFSG